MIKKILVLIIISFVNIISIAAYEKYSSGDLVRYNNIAFYVLFDSDSTKDSVQLIKMVPLSHDEINSYTDNKAYYKIKNSELIYEPSDSEYNYSGSLSHYFYGNMAYYYGDNCFSTDTYVFNNSGVKSGCRYDYESSNIKKVIDAWINENFNIEDIVEDELGYKSRLIKIDEYLSLVNTENDRITNAPNWLIFKGYKVWTMDTNNGCSVNETGNNCYNKVIGENSISTIQPYTSGWVVPTVTLKKDSIKKVALDSNEYHNNAKREYKIGDIINYNETQFYVIKNSGKEDNTVTLLKRYPLTKYELNTYGEGYINNYIYEYKGEYIEPGKVISDDGIYKVAYLSTSDCYSNSQNRTGETSGCNPNYDVSNVKHIVDNWLNVTIDDSDLKSDSYGYKARLINSDDLIDLGFVNREANTVGITNFKRGNDTPLFILDHQTKGMLTMIHSYTYRHYNGRVDHGITVADDGYNFVASSIPYNSFGTVRPVITLNKKRNSKKNN